MQEPNSFTSEPDGIVSATSARTDSTQASPTVGKKRKVSVELFPRRYKYRRERTSALHSEAWLFRNRWASQSFIRRIPTVQRNTHSRSKMPKCPNCQKEVYFGKICSLHFNFPLLVCFLHAGMHFLVLKTSASSARMRKQETETDKLTSA